MLDQWLLKITNTGKLIFEQRYAFALMGVVLIILPDEFLEKVGTANFVAQNKPYIFLITGLLLCSFFVDLCKQIISYAKKKLNRRKIQKSIGGFLSTLSPEEQILLTMARDSGTQSFPLDSLSPVVCALVHKKLLVRGMGYVTECTHSIPNSVWYHPDFKKLESISPEELMSQRDL